MPTRAFSIEDGNLGSKTILTSRTKAAKDIDLSFANVFVIVAKTLILLPKTFPTDLAANFRVDSFLSDK